MNLRLQILELRQKGYTYNQICEKLKCSKGTVSYHCKNNNLNSKVYRNYTEEELLLRLKTQKEKSNITWNNKILNSNFDDLSPERKRKYLLLSNNSCCDVCKLNSWLGKPIILEIDHIDGNNSNNDKSNLRILCPNCHSQTPTYRGKNKSGRKDKISDEILLETLIKFDFNMRQSLISLGLSPKGGNYKRCHNIVKQLSLV